MGKSTLIFMLVAIGLVLGAFVMEGGSIAALLAPTAIMIVVGGTIGAVGVAFPLEEIKKVPAALKALGSYKEKHLLDSIQIIKDLSAKIRKEGILSLDKEIEKIEDPFLVKGLRLMVDGVEAQTLKDILENDVYLASLRHKAPAEVLEAAGGFSPTMGVVGTVMGLISVLSNLSDPNSLGGKIALAFIATFFGVALANLIYLPLAAKLKAIDKMEQYEKGFFIEGLSLLHEAATTMLIEEKLKGYLEGKEQLEYEHKKNEKK